MSIQRWMLHFGADNKPYELRPAPDSELPEGAEPPRDLVEFVKRFYGEFGSGVPLGATTRYPSVELKWPAVDATGFIGKRAIQ